MDTLGGGAGSDAAKLHVVEEERAPLTGSWPRLYALVLGLLAFWITALVLFTERYAPLP